MGFLANRCEAYRSDIIVVLLEQVERIGERGWTGTEEKWEDERS